MRPVIVSNLEANCKEIRLGPLALAVPTWVVVNAVTCELDYVCDVAGVRKISCNFLAGHFAGKIRRASADKDRGTPGEFAPVAYISQWGQQRFFRPNGPAKTVAGSVTMTTTRSALFVRLRLPMLVGLLLLAATDATSAEKLPPWPVVTRTVGEQLATLQNYRDGDLLSQAEVAPIFKALETRGWVVADQAKIMGSVLPDDDFLVKELRTPAGLKFMRKIASYPQAYDEIDQLSRLPNGDLMVRDFLRFPHSDRTFINKNGPSPAMYARLVPDEKRRGAPTPADLQKPTGRIYTASQLLTRLQQSYRAAELGISLP